MLCKSNISTFFRNLSCVGNESLSDTVSVDDILITSVLDTSPVTSSSCFDPSSSSAKSSTFTVLSANKIFENRCPHSDPQTKDQKLITGNDQKITFKMIRQPNMMGFNFYRQLSLYSFHRQAVWIKETLKAKRGRISFANVRQKVLTNWIMTLS